jgi:hypothetical protein
MNIYKISIPTLRDNLIEIEYHDFFIRSENVPTLSKIRNLCVKLHESQKKFFGLYSGNWKKCADTIDSSHPTNWEILSQQMIHYSIPVHINLFSDNTKNLFSIKISELVIHDIN